MEPLLTERSEAGERVAGTNLRPVGGCHVLSGHPFSAEPTESARLFSASGHRALPKSITSLLDFPKGFATPLDLYEDSFGRTDCTNLEFRRGHLFGWSADAIKLKTI